MTNASGVTNLVLRFTGGNGFLFNVEWVEFTPISTLPVQLGWRNSGGQLQLNWLADHTGWRMEAQTNPPGAGLGTNWMTVSGSTTTDTMALPINPTNGSMFYRLMFP